MSSSPSPAPPTAPRPTRRPKVLEAWGDRRIDDWFWLRDRSDPAVLQHLRAELAYAEVALEGLEPLRRRMYDEIVDHIEETDVSVPVRDGQWWYYRRTRQGDSFAVHCRRPWTADQPPPVAEQNPAGGGQVVLDEHEREQVVLDENELASGSEYFALGILSMSPDHRLVAAGVDTSGDERMTLQIRRLDTGDPPEYIPEVSYGLAWSRDSTRVFYTRLDPSLRPYQVWQHVLGRPASTDILVLEEPDERFHLSLTGTKDQQLIVISLDSSSTSEVWTLSAGQPDGRPVVVAPRRTDVEYAVEHLPAGPGGNGALLMLTNEAAPDFRVLAAADGPDGPGGAASDWSELVPHRAGTRIQELDVMAGHLVLGERLEGEARIRVIPIGTEWNGPLAADPPSLLEHSRLVPASAHPSTFDIGANPEPTAPEFRFTMTSLTTPPVVADYDLASGEVAVRKRQPVHHYAPERYTTFRMWATADDGTRVPLSVVHRRDLLADPDAPDGGPPACPASCLLYGYGAYEHSVDPAFSVTRLSLLDRGFVFAIAHVRGGGELGRHWYEEGRRANKMHTFTDYLACARALVSAGFTTPEQLVGRGASAGGLLIGAVANLAPGLFRALVAEVPFVDCLTTMLDPTLPLTAIEWEEWGDPITDEHAYALMKSYSPYDNVVGRDGAGAPVRYPDLLVTAGLEDPRVGFWEPAKWVAELRAANSANRVVLRPELSAGHRGPSGRYAAWRDEALILAFIVDAVGLDHEGRQGELGALRSPPAAE